MFEINQISYPAISVSVFLGAPKFLAAPKV